MAYVPPMFGGFYDKNGWGGTLPSRRACRRILLNTCAARKEFLDKRMMMIPPTDVLKGDASKKAVRRIRAEGSKIFESLHTFCNR